MAAARWLIIGHGSVGASLRRRMNRRGLDVTVLDPTPRLPVEAARHLKTLDGSEGPFDRVISCVLPSAALSAISSVSSSLTHTSLYFDWNTLPPEVKHQVAAHAPCTAYDVALLDTLDSEAVEPMLAISGPDADGAAGELRLLGFRVEVAGAACGEAAALKLARSLFMKSLEALVIEFEATIAALSGREIVTASIERNVGAQFVAFARMLLETDRLHAGRRAAELQQAVDIFRSSGRAMRLASASTAVLRDAAAAWARSDAPATDAGATSLAEYLALRLDGEQGDARG